MTLFRKLSILLLVAIIPSVSSTLQAQQQNPIPIEQHFYAGGSVGLFDGLTTSSTYGFQFGWIGPTKSIAPIGGMNPEVTFAIQYIPKVHLERLRYIPDAIAEDAIAASVVAGPRFGGLLGFRTLFGVGIATAKAPLTRCATNATPNGAADWVLLAQVENGKLGASSAPANSLSTEMVCGKNDRRFPFVSEIGPDLQLKRFRITVPLVITTLGDRETRMQYSFRLGVDFSFGRN